MPITEITNSLISSTSPDLITTVLTAVGAKKLYDDLASPTVKSAGILGAKIFNALLISVDAWGERRKQRFSRLSDEVTTKLREQHPDNISSEVPDYILIPAINSYMTSVDSDALRTMYANLIAKALLKSKIESIHPAFISILQNLHPKECLILKYMYQVQRPLPMLQTRHEVVTEQQISTGYTSLTNIYMYPTTINSPESTSFNSIPDMSEYTNFELGPVYAPTNLARLGIANITYDAFLTANNVYDVLMGCKEIKDDELKCKERGRSFSISKGFMELTPLGISFADICIGTIK